MGNFYTNVTMRHADPAEISALLKASYRTGLPWPICGWMDQAFRNTFGVERMAFLELPFALERHLTPL